MKPTPRTFHMKMNPFNIIFNMILDKFQHFPTVFEVWFFQRVSFLEGPFFLRSRVWVLVRFLQMPIEKCFKNWVFERNFWLYLWSSIMAIVLFNLISQWSYFNYAHNSINVDTGGIFEFDILEINWGPKKPKAFERRIDCSQGSLLNPISHKAGFPYFQSKVWFTPLPLQWKLCSFS